MDQHRRALQNLCRLCGEEFKSGVRSNQSKLTIKHQIKTVFGLDIEGDDSDIHPTSCCNACRMKLHKFVLKKRRKQQGEVGIHLYAFSSHDHESCAVCEKVAWSLEDTKRLAIEKGFLAWIKRGKCTAVVMDDFGEKSIKRIVFEEASWKVYVMGNEIVSPVEVNTKNVGLILITIIEDVVCEGNHGFYEANNFYASKSGKDTSDENVAVLEPQFFDGNDLVNEVTIKHKLCQQLIKPDESAGGQTSCKVCKQYRCDIAAVESRLKKKVETPSTRKFTRNDLLSKEQLQQKVSELQQEKDKFARHVQTLKNNVRKIMTEESVAVDDDSTNNKLADVLLSTSEELGKCLPDDSHAKLLWEQQMKALQAKDKRQMRWHPDIIRWAIALHSKSASAYRVIRESGFLVLPHPNTLYTYTHFTQLEAGLNADLMQRIYVEWNIEHASEGEKLVSLLLDEMKIKSGLVYSRSSNKLIGFTDVGDIEQEVKLFEQKCTVASGGKPISDQNLASHVLVFMIRGIVTGLKSPIAYFPTQNVTGGQLVPLVWKCVRGLALISLSVKCLVADGASSNRKLFSLLGGSGVDASDPQYYAKNVYEDKGEGEKLLYFICDVPHLLKTTRNNIENSGWNKRSRKLVCKNKEIKWTHLLTVYEKDQGMDRESPGLRLLPKLRHEHFHLTPSLRMKVSLAAQVLSSSMGNALEREEKAELSSTGQLIRLMDKFFDCLNVRSEHGWKRAKNENLQPYRSPDDVRLKWLVEDFLGFFREWERKVADVPGLSKSERNRRCLSRATTSGFTITVMSFVQIVKDMLELDGVNFILSDRFNQDPLEEFFSKQRGAGGFHDNPSVEQFRHHMLDNIVAGSSSRASSRANVRRADLGTSGLGETPLVKKKRTTSKE